MRMSNLLEHVHVDGATIRLRPTDGLGEVSFECYTPEEAQVDADALVELIAELRRRGSVEGLTALPERDDSHVAVRHEGTLVAELPCRGEGCGRAAERLMAVLANLSQPS